LIFEEKWVQLATMAQEFAVIETGGKQYTVSKGDVISIEKIKGEHKPGDKLVFDKVLLVDNGKDTTLGNPYIKGAQVEGELQKEAKGKKVTILRFKSKSNYSKKKGHRQPFMEVKISAIK